MKRILTAVLGLALLGAPAAAFARGGGGGGHAVGGGGFHGGGGAFPRRRRLPRGTSRWIPRRLPHRRTVRRLSRPGPRGTGLLPRPLRRRSRSRPGRRRAPSGRSHRRPRLPGPQRRRARRIGPGWSYAPYPGWAWGRPPLGLERVHLGLAAGLRAPPTYRSPSERGRLCFDPWSPGLPVRLTGRERFGSLSLSRPTRSRRAHAPASCRNAKRRQHQRQAARARTARAFRSCRSGYPLRAPSTNRPRRCRPRPWRSSRPRPSCRRCCFARRSRCCRRSPSSRRHRRAEERRCRRRGAHTGRRSTSAPPGTGPWHSRPCIRPARRPSGPCRSPCRIPCRCRRRRSGPAPPWASRLFRWGSFDNRRLPDRRPPRRPGRRRTRSPGRDRRSSRSGRPDRADRRRPRSRRRRPPIADPILVCSLVLMHLGSLQSPSVVSQTVGGPQGNSVVEQGLTQTPRLQTCPTGQRPGASRIVDDAVTVVIEEVAGLRPRLDVLPALDVHAAVRALGGAAGADAGLSAVAGLPAARAVDAADVEDEVVEVAVVAGAGIVGQRAIAGHAASPAGRTGRLVLERDVVAVRIAGRLVDERRDPRQPFRRSPGGRVRVDRPASTSSADKGCR